MTSYFSGNEGFLLNKKLPPLLKKKMEAYDHGQCIRSIYLESFTVMGRKNMHITASEIGAFKKHVL